MENEVEVIYECNKSLTQRCEKEIAINKVKAVLLSLDKNMLLILSKNIRIRIRDDLWDKKIISLIQDIIGKLLLNFLLKVSSTLILKT